MDAVSIAAPREESESIDRRARRLAQERVSVWLLVRDIALDWTILLVALVLATPDHLALLPFCILVIGVHQHALSILGHEASHFTISKTKWLNDAIGNVIFFYPLTVTVSGYRRFHIQHHLKLNSMEDPELPLRAGRFYNSPMSIAGFAAMFIGDLFGFGIPSLYRLVWASRPTSVRDAAGLFVFWVITISAVIYAHQQFRLAIWAISLGTAYWAVSRMRVWCEHTSSDTTNRHWQSPLVAYLLFPHNNGYHYEHHMWPYLSYQKLPIARAIDNSRPVLAFTELMRSFGTRK
ncbi:MAG: fatty acid desaturase [Proteobacteria bacterium]|nr:fatty acid desaturase [Pseudomonadota bacterium]